MDYDAELHGGALRPGGRLVMMVWQAHEHFSLADPGTVEGILGAAGFTDVKFSDVREPVYYGESVDAAMEWVGGFRFVRNILQGLDAAAATRLLASLRDALAKKSSEQGVWFDAREWLVTAQRH